MSGAICGAAVSAAAAALLTPQVRWRLKVPRWLLWLTASIAVAITVNELVGKPVPLLRWSVPTMMLRGRHLLREWQVGDGRETALEKYVLAPAPVTWTTLFELSITSAGTSAFSSTSATKRGRSWTGRSSGLRPGLLFGLVPSSGKAAWRWPRLIPGKAGSTLLSS